MIVEFEIPGYTLGKQRPRFVRRGKFVSTYTPQKTHDYQDSVREAYNKVAKGKLLEGAIKAEICSIYEPPKSVSKKVRQKMISGEIPYLKKPDSDNIAKSILDGLNEIAYKDDSSIDELIVRKMYGEKAMSQVRLSDNKHVVKPLFFMPLIFEDIDNGGIT